MEEKWYILAGTLVWSVVLILIALILIRLLKQYRMEQRMEQMEEAEARRVANRFASIASSQHNSSDSVTTIDLQQLNDERPARRWRLFGRGRRRPQEPPTEPARPLYGPQSFGIHGITPEELQTHCPVVIHEESKDSGKDTSAEGQLSEDGRLICAICLDEVSYGQRKRVLPCLHTFHARCVQIWLQRSNKCPCCMKFVVVRLMIPPLPEIGVAQLLGVPMPNGEVLPFARIRDQRSRFLGLWTFGNRGYDPELVERIRQATILSDEMADARASALAAARANGETASTEHAVRADTPRANAERRNADSGAHASASRVSSGGDRPQVQEFAEQLQRSHQIDNMIDATA